MYKLLGRREYEIGDYNTGEMIQLSIVHSVKDDTSSLEGNFVHDHASCNC